MFIWCKIFCCGLSTIKVQVCFAAHHTKLLFKRIIMDYDEITISIYKNDIDVLWKCIPSVECGRLMSML
jgi:hypothetical protein